MKYGLSDRALNTLQALFRKYTGITKVILYGSRAMGNYKNGSDIDISLETDDTFKQDDLLHLMSDLDDSDLPYFVDCSIYKDLQNENLKAHIDRVGQVFYTKA
jgi:predicted nucleotidyltransferase